MKRTLALLTLLAALAVTTLSVHARAESGFTFYPSSSTSTGVSAPGTSHQWHKFTIGYADLPAGATYFAYTAKTLTAPMYSNNTALMVATPMCSTCEDDSWVAYSTFTLTGGGTNASMASDGYKLYLTSSTAFMQIYDPADGSWVVTSTVAPTFNGNIVKIVHDGADGILYAQPNTSQQLTVYRYSVAASTWAAFPASDLKSTNAGYVATAYTGGKAYYYVIGSSAAFKALDTATETWGPFLPTPFNGSTTDGTTPAMCDSPTGEYIYAIAASRTLWRYDIAGSTWTQISDVLRYPTGASVPAPTTGASLLRIGNFLYYLGANTLTTNNGTTYPTWRYSLASGSWEMTSLATVAPTVGQSTYAQANGKIYGWRSGPNANYIGQMVPLAATHSSVMLLYAGRGSGTAGNTYFADYAFAPWTFTRSVSNPANPRALATDDTLVLYIYGYAPFEELTQGSWAVYWLGSVGE